MSDVHVIRELMELLPIAPGDEDRCGKARTTQSHAASSSTAWTRLYLSNPTNRGKDTILHLGGSCAVRLLENLSTNPV